METGVKTTSIKFDIFNLDKLQNVIKVLGRWAEDERIPEDARQEMVDALNGAINTEHKPVKVYYECDGRACKDRCSKSAGYCHCTTDIRHAKKL
jgi:hypothetical protein